MTLHAKTLVDGRSDTWLRLIYRWFQHEPVKVWLLTFSKIPCYSVEHCWYTPVNIRMFPSKEMPRPQFFCECATRKPDDCSIEQKALLRSTMPDASGIRLCYVVRHKE
jgi:hypothetical protein